MRTWQLVGLGFLMVLGGGVIVPFLMVIQAIPSTFFLNFFSYVVGLVGLMLGMIGMANYVRQNRK
jgi:hypothetical protein